MLPYYELDTLVAMIDPPNRRICQRILDENRLLFRQAAGSSYNHQAWTGGYWDHITEVMNLWMLLYAALESTGRLNQLEPAERFSRSDGLLVLFWHDIEKPWNFVLKNGKPVIDRRGRVEVLPSMRDKAARKRFAEAKIRDYGLVLNPSLRNALDYVEGIRDVDYSPYDRRMRPLAALCHACDLLSARAFYGFPLVRGNTWGARAAA